MLPFAALPLSFFRPFFLRQKYSHKISWPPLVAETTAPSSSAAAAGRTDKKNDDTSSSSANIINLRVLNGSERLMRNAAEFMVDAF
jgi:hypothetical protein